MDIIKDLTAGQLKENAPKVSIGDTVLTKTEFEAIMLDVYGNPRNVKDVLKHNNIKD